MKRVLSLLTALAMIFCFAPKVSARAEKTGSPDEISAITAKVESTTASAMEIQDSYVEMVNQFTETQLQRTPDVLLFAIILQIFSYEILGNL